MFAHKARDACGGEECEDDEGRTCDEHIGVGDVVGVVDEVEHEHCAQQRADDRASAAQQHP